MMTTIAAADTAATSIATITTLFRQPSLSTEFFDFLPRREPHFIAGEGGAKVGLIVVMLVVAVSVAVVVLAVVQ